MQPVLELILVARLPELRNPYKCSHYDRFQRMKVEIAQGRVLTNEIVHEAGRRFWRELSEGDIKSCRRHQVDWRAIADEAVRIVMEQPVDGYHDAVLAGPFSDLEQSCLESLLLDPIQFHEHGYTNGQHRACGVRFSGATHVPVAVGWVG